MCAAPQKLGLVTNTTKSYNFAASFCCPPFVIMTKLYFRLQPKASMAWQYEKELVNTQHNATKIKSKEMAPSAPLYSLLVPFSNVVLVVAKGRIQLLLLLHTQELPN